MFTGKRLAVYIPVIAMLLCLVSLSVQGATFNLAPTADAYVSGGSATTNYGTNANLLVKGAATASYIRESYLKFDLAGVTGTITSATLKLYCTSIEGTPASVDAYTCTTDSWTETGITYSNKPAKGTLITSVNIPSAAAWYSFDVTDFVNGQYAGDKIVTIILAQGSTVKKNVYFNSKEAASDKPVLEVITGTASTPTPTPTLTPTPTATPTPTPSSSPGVNLALNKPVTFSSQQAGNEASHAVDGDLATRWSADTYPEWIQVDLGATYTVNRTEVCPYLDRAYQFKVEVSTNGTSYTQVVDRLSNTTGGAVISDTFAAASARYVKLTVTGASGYTGTWTSINEFRVFNSGSLPSPTPTPTSTPTPTPSYTPTPPASTPTPTPTSTPIGGEGYMIITEADLMALPTSGPEYDFMKGIADSTFPGVNLADQDN
ncbi:MAG: DNRLRE domain-containing protein, partial [Bacteroidota bacterium]